MAEIEEKIVKTMLENGELGYAKIKEYWRVIPGYSRYLASTFGRIFDTKKDKFLKLTNVTTCINVSLWDDEGVHKQLKVHRVIVHTFNSSFDINDPSQVVDHLDENPFNNCLWNFEVTTLAENLRRGQYSGNLYLIEYHNTKNIKLYTKVSDLAEYLNVSVSTIYRNAPQGKPYYSKHMQKWYYIGYLGNKNKNNQLEEVIAKNKIN